MIEGSPQLRQQFRRADTSRPRTGKALCGRLVQVLLCECVGRGSGNECTIVFAHPEGVGDEFVGQ